MAELTEDEAPLSRHLVAVANRLAREAAISEKAYRLVVNYGRGRGQPRYLAVIQANASVPVLEQAGIVTIQPGAFPLDCRILI